MSFIQLLHCIKSEGKILLDRQQPILLWHGMLGNKQISRIEYKCSKDARAYLMCDNIRRDDVSNNDILAKLHIAPEEKM